jgi:hypothetical protein
MGYYIKVKTKEELMLACDYFGIYTWVNGDDVDNFIPNLLNVGDPTYLYFDKNYISWFEISNLEIFLKKSKDVKEITIKQIKLKKIVEE